MYYCDIQDSIHPKIKFNCQFAAYLHRFSGSVVLDSSNEIVKSVLLVLKTYVVVKYASFFFCRSVVISLADEDFKSAVLVFKICAVEEYAFFFSFSRSTEIGFFDEDFKSTLSVFNKYFGVEYAFCLLFAATVDSFNEAVEDVLVNWGAVEDDLVNWGAVEDICINREADERTVVDLIVEFGRSWVSHLIINFPPLSPIKII